MMSVVMTPGALAETEMVRRRPDCGVWMARPSSALEANEVTGELALIVVPA